MSSDDEVCILIPTLDEATTIGEVIEGFQVEGFWNILVVDGGSTDETREIAEAQGADVIIQSGRGKGQAVREAVEHIEAEYILMVDGDGTYRPSDAPRLLEPVRNGSADHVIGNRFADMAEGAMTWLNRIGNRLINRAFAVVHGRQLKDILSGYRAFRKDSFEEIDPSVDGFGIETELSVGCIKRNQRTTVVPIHYGPRPDGSSTNLHPIRDGGIILLTLYRLARTNNPMFYFGSAGALSSIVGLFFGFFVGYRWFVHGVSHEVLALLSAFGLIFGVQLLMFGLLSDMIITLHREQMRELERQEE